MLVLERRIGERPEAHLVEGLLAVGSIVGSRYHSVGEVPVANVGSASSPSSTHSVVGPNTGGSVSVCAGGDTVDDVDPRERRDRPERWRQRAEELRVDLDLVGVRRVDSLPLASFAATLILTMRALSARRASGEPGDAGESSVISSDWVPEIPAW